jgi:FkbM family methyltransferase
MPDTPLLTNGNLRIRKCRHGTFAYLLNDLYIGRSFDLYGEYAEGEIALFRQLVKPGNVVVEVGANIGAHTVSLAEFAGEDGQVIAFEPQRPIFHLLCTNVTLNGLMNVNTYRAAVSDTPGSLLVPRLDYRKPNNFGALELGKPWPDGSAVQVTTLDALKLAACHFVKVDVEGMELKVLQGATTTIDKHRPLLYLENDRGDNSRALVDFLFKRRYKVFWHTTPLFNPKNFFAATENIFENVVAPNILCVPRELALNVVAMTEITSLDNCTWPPRKP